MDHLDQVDLLQKKNQSKKISNANTTRRDLTNFEGDIGYIPQGRLIGKDGLPIGSSDARRIKQHQNYKSKTYQKDNQRAKAVKKINKQRAFIKSILN